MFPARPGLARQSRQGRIRADEIRWLFVWESARAGARVVKEGLVLRTAKVKKQDGFHCLYCNATVSDSDVACSGCGRFFGSVTADMAAGTREDRKAGPSAVPTNRLKRAFRGHRQSYRLPVIVLAACVVLLAVMFRPRPGRNPVLPMPQSQRPAYELLEVREMPSGGVNRLSVVGLVHPETARDSIRAVLDWLLYSTLDEQNRSSRRSVRVIWAYVLTDSLAPKSSWSGMAIWADPSLPEPLKPAGIGGDAVKSGPVEYDLTNPAFPTTPGSRQRSNP